MGTLYLVPTPVGNLEDITLRALRVLKEVKLVAAEDTRETRKLLRHYEIETKMISFHEYSELTKMKRVFDALKGGDVGLVSDAGSPGISDPGFKLVREAIKRGVKVVPLPGASALVPALTGSGLAADRFLFLGFLPKKGSARKKALEKVKAEEGTLIIYESPYRVVETLKDVLEVLGDREICVAREISKKHEEFYRAKASKVIERYEKEKVIGEVVLVIAGVGKTSDVWSDEMVEEKLSKRLAKGEALSAAAKGVAKKSGWNKSQVYHLGLRVKDEN